MALREKAEAAYQRAATKARREEGEALKAGLAELLTEKTGG